LDIYKSLSVVKLNSFENFCCEKLDEDKNNKSK